MDIDSIFAALSAPWPIFAFAAGIVYALIRIHVDVENLKEKVKVLYTLWNDRDKK